MINRNDMLELTRRMTLERASIDRIAGAYFDEEGYVDGTFNRHFLRLSPSERNKNLALAKAVIFAKTNEELKDYRIADEERKPGSFWQLLDAIKECGLKNDALLDVFYEWIGKQVKMHGEWYCYLFHGCYDIPVKGTDGGWLEGSEEIYEYLIVAIGSVTEDYNPQKPQCGFLYPAFRDRSGDERYWNVLGGNDLAL